MCSLFVRDFYMAMKPAFLPVKLSLDSLPNGLFGLGVLAFEHDVWNGH